MAIDTGLTDRLNTIRAILAVMIRELAILLCLTRRMHQI
jgi:hypothetical protein